MVFVADYTTNFLIFILAMLAGPNGYEHVDVLQNGQVVESYAIAADGNVQRINLDGGSTELIGRLQPITSTVGVHYTWSAIGKEPVLHDATALAEAIEGKATEAELFGETYKMSFGPGAVYLSRGETMIVVHGEAPSRRRVVRQRRTIQAAE